MIRLTSLLAVLAIGTLGACDDDDDDIIDDIDDDDDDDDDDDEQPSALRWNATLTGLDIYSALEGQATVTQGVGAQAFVARASIRNDMAGAVRPWHVHFGTCGSGGGIVGSDLAYPRLQVGGDGSAAAEVRIELALDPGAAYHVNVHLSDAQLGTLIACGDLMLTN